MAFFQIRSQQHLFWWYFLCYTLGPIGLLVLAKILLGIKILKVRKEKFDVCLPFRLHKKTFGAKDLKSWTHTKIKTYGGVYEQITLQLKSGKTYAFSKQENTACDKLLSYMKKKFSKIRA